MPSKTTNYGLIKPNEDEFYDVQVQNGNMDIIDQQLKVNADKIVSQIEENFYGIVTGTNELVMINEKVNSYKEGMLVAFKNTTENTGAVTLNINELGAKSIKKSNGKDLISGNLKAGGVYQVRYDGVNFFLLGEGGEYGTAGASQVLEGYTVGQEDGIAKGTMPNRGAITIIPNQSNQTIPNGYHNGSGIVQAVSFDASKVLAGTTIAGKAGTMPQRATVFKSGTWANEDGNTYVDATVTIEAGYYPQGTSISAQITDPGLIPANIVQGKNIFGVAGSATVESMGGRKFATGIVTVANENIYFTRGTGSNIMTTYLTVTGLNFKPTKILTMLIGTSNPYFTTVYNLDAYSNLVFVSYDDDNNETYRITGNAYINNTGFQLPAYRGQWGTQHRWVAIE